VNIWLTEPTHISPRGDRQGPTQLITRPLRVEHQYVSHYVPQNARTVLRDTLKE